jgi:hypothetical protein
MHYATKNLAQDEIVAYQIQIFFSEIIDHLNSAKNVNEELVSEINDSLNNFQITEKFSTHIKLQEPEVKLIDFDNF